MTYCRRCNTEMESGTNVCPNCGLHQRENVTTKWPALGCCLPPVGILLYFLWRKSKPITAKAVLWGAIFCLSMLAVWYVLIFIMGMTAMAAV